MSTVLRKPYTVEYLEVSPAKDITQYVGSLPKMTHYDIDKTNAAAITLDVGYGAFITNDNSGDTPILSNDYDKFKITLSRNGKSYVRVFELKTDLSQKSNQGQSIPLELLGQDHNLEDILCTGNFEVPNVITFYDVIMHVVKQYNKGKGTKQAFLNTVFIDLPTVEERNEAPKTIPIAIDFSDRPNCKVALQRIKARMNLSVSQGGTGTKWGFVIEDHPTAENEMVLSVFEQGKLPASPVTITNPHFIAKRKEAKTGTRIIVEGEAGTGGLPDEPHRFFSLVEEFNEHPDYISGEIYATGVRVQVDGIHYEAIQDVPITFAPPLASHWKVIEEKDVIGSFQVSPWTQNKAALVRNFFSNPENSLNTNFNSPAIIDGNAVIREPSHWRDWALIRSNTDQLNPGSYQKYLWNQNNLNGKYEGLRILVDPNVGTLAGAFAENGGKDRFGKNFENSLCMYTGTEWIVLRELQVEDEVAVRAEGKVWQYNYVIAEPRVRHKSSVFSPPSGPVELRDISGTFLGNDCFHYPSGIQNATGLFRQIDAPSGKYTDNSAIEITYSYTLDPVTSQALIALLSIPDGLIPGDQIDDLLELNIYNAGWWAPIFFSPFPESTFNGISEEIGEIYGGVLDAPNPDRRFAVIDFSNDNYTPTGNQGMNHEESRLLGELTGFKFNFKLEIKEGTNLAAFKGNIPMSIIIYDTESNVWKATKNYRIHGDVEPMEYSWSDFQIFKSRTPWGTDTLFSNIVVPDLDIRDIFEQKKVKFAILQMERSYDDVGRYQPFNFDNFVQAFFGAGDASIVGSYDIPRFVKKAVATTDVTTERTIIPQPLQIKGVRNLKQLENIAFAEKDLREKQYEGYAVETDLEFDIDPEVGFYLSDSDIIKEADNGPNTQLLVMKDKYYSVDGLGAITHFTGEERI